MKRRDVITIPLKCESHPFQHSMATTPSWISAQRERQSWEPSEKRLLCILESCLYCTSLELLLELLFYVNQVPQNLGDKQNKTQALHNATNQKQWFDINLSHIQTCSRKKRSDQRMSYVLVCLSMLWGRQLWP